MGLADYLILALVAVLLFLAIRYLLHKKGSGCSGCCQNCTRHTPNCKPDSDATKP